MNVLSLSDTIIPFLYGPQASNRFKDHDIIIACGDLGYFYLEYIMNALDRPLFFVRGNHDKVVEYSANLQRTAPAGGVDLHSRNVKYSGVLMAGVEGSLRYRPGLFQYSQSEMWRHVFNLVPGLISNRLLHGRYLDIFVTHAPPSGIHDREDLPHQGIKAFRWLNTVFKPAYHFHGHIHLYHPDSPKVTQFGQTTIINTYGFLETKICIPAIDGKPLQEPA